jgi:hypothetical protein
MHRPVVRLATLVAVALTATATTSVFAQPGPQPSPGTSQTPKARCSQLLSFYDWYGASRSENTDGARHHERMRAGMECERGDYQAGIARMEDLLQRKNFSLPPPTGVAQVPAPPGPPVR